MSLLVLFIGVGMWGVLLLPALLSQEEANFNPPRITAPPAAGTGLPMGSGSLPPTGTTFDTGSGAPPSGNPSAAPPDAVGFGGAAGGPPGFVDFGTVSGSSTGAAGPQYSVPQPGGPPGMMDAMPPMMGMSGMPGLTPSQVEEMNLARHAKGLLSRYGKEQKPEVKEKIKSELRSVLHRQFRLQHQRRDAELSQIERRLADLRSKLKKRADAQSTIVDRRLEQLVNDVDGLGWSVEEVPDNLFNEGMGGSMMPGMGGRGGMMPQGGLGGGLGGGAPVGYPGGVGLGGTSSEGAASPPALPEESGSEAVPSTIDGGGETPAKPDPNNPGGPSTTDPAGLLPSPQSPGTPVTPRSS